MMAVTFDAATASAADSLIRMALAEDLDERGDLTSLSTIPADMSATVNLVSRQNGIVCGTPLIQRVFRELQTDAQVDINCQDGSTIVPGSLIAVISGPVRSLLTAERTVLNFMIHLSGVATRTAAFVEQVRGTKAVVLDTRKTLPGYRLLHKYAVRCGGGTNHRIGLYDGILIKDNHLAARGDQQVAAAVRDARSYMAENGLRLPVEIEVDTIVQLRDALQVLPEIVLLDNMEPELLKQAVHLRNQMAPETRLEASGGVTLETVRAIAESGVERISVGSLTHSAPALDLGFDWPW